MHFYSTYLQRSGGRARNWMASANLDLSAVRKWTFDCSKTRNEEWKGTRQHSMSHPYLTPCFRRVSLHKTNWKISHTSSWSDFFVFFSVKVFLDLTLLTERWTKKLTWPKIGICDSNRPRNRNDTRRRNRPEDPRIWIILSINNIKYKYVCSRLSHALAILTTISRELAIFSFLFFLF